MRGVTPLPLGMGSVKIENDGKKTWQKTYILN